MPRASRVASGIVGSPAPFEKRTCARTGSPLKCAAFEIAARLGGSEGRRAQHAFGMGRPVPGMHAVRPVERVDQPVGEIPLDPIRSHAEPYASSVTCGARHDLDAGGHLPR